MRLLYIALLLSALSFGQDRNGISYQALILNPQGEQLPGANNNTVPMANTEVCLRFHITTNAGSYNEYSERQVLTTDAYGMINTVVGTGAPVGTIMWNQIVWTEDSKGLKVEIDYSGECSSFVALSSQELTSVPFALYSPASNIPGPPGEAGDSAYQVWIDEGNTGTEQEFLDSLKGTDGEPGDPGADGDSAYQLWIDEGNTGTEQEFLDSLKGIDGEPGKNGEVAIKSIINTSDEAAGDNCANGGVKIEFGEDANADGVLGTDELTQVQYICNGNDGLDGQNGQDSSGVGAPCLLFSEVGEENYSLINEAGGAGNMTWFTTEYDFENLNSNKFDLFVLPDTSISSNLRVTIKCLDSNGSQIDFQIKHDKITYRNFDGDGGSYTQPEKEYIFSNSDVYEFEIIGPFPWDNERKYFFNEINIISNSRVDKINIELATQGNNSSNQSINSFQQGKIKLVKYLCNSIASSNNTAPSNLEVGSLWGGGIVTHIAKPGELLYVEDEIHGIIAPLFFVYVGATTNPLSGFSTQDIETYGQKASSEIGGGKQNTTLYYDLFSSSFNGSNIGDGNSFEVCKNIVIDGYDDWFLPNLRELQTFLALRENVSSSSPYFSQMQSGMVYGSPMRGNYAHSGNYYSSVGKVIPGAMHINMNCCSGEGRTLPMRTF